MKEHLNYIILYDGAVYRVFERLGKKVPFEAYNPQRHLGIGSTVDEAVENSVVLPWEIQRKPIEVVFNE